VLFKYEDGEDGGTPVGPVWIDSSAERPSCAERLLGQRTEKPRSRLGDSQFNSTSSTCAPEGPRPHQSTIDSTGGSLTLEHRFDAPIRKVPDPAGDSAGLGAVAHLAPKEDSPARARAHARAGRFMASQAAGDVPRAWAVGALPLGGLAILEACCFVGAAGGVAGTVRMSAGARERAAIDDQVFLAYRTSIEPALENLTRSGRVAGLRGQ
jgi:hypothetical protein